MNKEFFEYISKVLNDKYDLYLKSLKSPLNKGFNINELKNLSEEFFSFEKIKCKKSIFSNNSYIFLDEKSYGNTFSHIMGLMYIQEPSASSVVEFLDVKPNEKILDMCAAPGGKSTQIAIKMNNTGTLVSNEYDFSRAKILLSNIERLGIKNTVVTSMDTTKLCEKFEGFFDRVLVDAPCSGEGMFKKYPESIKEWSLSNVYACAKRQLEILENAHFALKENGILIYSTCTLNTIENEEVVLKFLNKHNDMELVKIDAEFGSKGIGCNNVLRIMPYDGGEGQFIAKFVKKSSTGISKIKYINHKLDKVVSEFLETLNYKFKYFLNDNNKIYGSDEEFLDLKCLRNKVLIGEIVKGRFEPHHHLYTSLKKHDFKNYVEITEEDAKKFISGNTLEINGFKGYVAIIFKNHVLGFGKGDGNIIKNKYPKGLRKA